MSDNLPCISFKLFYYLAEPFSLEVQVLESYSKWVFFEHDTAAIQSLYWILKVLPNQLRKYLIARLARDHIPNDIIKIPLKSLIDRLNGIAVPERLDLPSSEFEIASFYLSNYFEPTAHVRAMTLERLIDTLKFELSDLLTRNYFFINKTQIQTRLDNFIDFCKQSAHSLFIFLRFFRDLKYYSSKRYIDSYFELEQQQLEILRNQFRHEFKTFTKHKISICE